FLIHITVSISGAGFEITAAGRFATFGLHESAVCGMGLCTAMYTITNSASPAARIHVPTIVHSASGDINSNEVRFYCTDTTRSSRERVGVTVVRYVAILARPWRSSGSRIKTSTTPKTGIAKLKGSNAKNPKARVAGN